MGDEEWDTWKGGGEGMGIEGGGTIGDRGKKGERVRRGTWRKGGTLVRGVGSYRRGEGIGWWNYL
jgi:hypothetical protein